MGFGTSSIYYRELSAIEIKVFLIIKNLLNLATFNLKLLFFFFMRKIAIFIVLLFFLIATASATTLTVNPKDSHAYKTI